LHRRYRTPWFTITLFSFAAALLLLPGKTDFLGNLYSFGAMLSFTIAHVSVLGLRIKEPERERPYRMPWNVRRRGKEIPLTAVLGALGTFAAWLSVLALHAEARTVGVAWMLVGIAGYLLYRRRIGVDPRESVRIERSARPPNFQPFEYRAALVPLFGSDVDADAIRSAAKLVGEDAGVDVLYLIEIPVRYQFDAALDDEEQRARNVLEAAKLAGQGAGVKINGRVLRTRSAGKTIVEEATRLRSDAIYLATSHAPPGERGLGPLARYLLQARPCRIVVETAPAAQRPLASRARQLARPT
jgi:APA family basic amino acid/polyamine antiporter